ncbi:hypothetical protein RhiirA1_399898 [Rhizophagus irregularis]|uniref:Uncharacterized protein n=1 Tax=Rhizophagus irregularis TaxID=588596 RepID=A0A2N0R866_9GLOM|nr:hypothetical protein RhiirA1_399898 [Rhizophagus irregularis]
MTPGDLKVYNETTECWICKGFFIKPVLEIVQKIEKAKHNLLEIKEWESCIEKEHFKKKEILARIWKWRPILACNSEMETDFSLKTGDFSLKLKWGLILVQNSEIETSDFGPELKWEPILAQNLEIATGDLIKF